MPYAASRQIRRALDMGKGQFALGSDSSLRDTQRPHEMSPQVSEARHDMRAAIKNISFLHILFIPGIDW